MSSDSAGSGGDLLDRARNPYEGLDIEREEGITTTPKVLPGGARHGGGAKFVLDDIERDADAVQDKFDVGDRGRQIPNGSLYQHARAAWYEAESNGEFVEDSDGRKYAVLTRSYQHPAEDEPDEYAVTLRSSRWDAGKGHGEDYRPWFKYDLTVQPVADDGTILWGKTPPKSLSLKIEPQVTGLVYPDGNSLELPHGEGSLCRVQTTWVDEPSEFVRRTAHLVGASLNYGLRTSDIVRDSAAFSKAEVHHRFVEECEGDVVHTIRQSAELLAKHAADVTTRGVHEDSRWLEAKIRTDEWEQLGYPMIDAPILLKVYYPNDPDSVEYPMDQPKIEVALDGKETVVDENGQSKKQMIPWNRWEEIMAVLDEILLSHLEWADVGPQHLVADDYSDGANSEPVQFRHPDGRRHWLRKHYESLVPALYREATRTRTDLVLDILDVVRRRERASYDDLVAETGAAKRTIRQHVRRLENVGGDDAPGILKRVRDSKTFVVYSSRFLEELGDDAVDSIQADREELAGDRSDRADTRVEDHLRDLGFDEDDSESLVDAVVDDRVHGRDTLRDADDPSDLEDLVDDLDLDVDAAAEDSSEEAESESVQEESADEDESPCWETFDTVPISGEILGTALDDGVIAGEHVEIRTDPYPRLTD